MSTRPSHLPTRTFRGRFRFSSFRRIPEPWDASGNRASLSESGFTGLAGFSGFHFAHLALFAITANPAKTNMNSRLPVKDARRENPEKSYNPVNPDSDKKPAPAIPLWEKVGMRARRASEALRAGRPRSQWANPPWDPIKREWIRSPRFHGDDAVGIHT